MLRAPRAAAWNWSNRRAPVERFAHDEQSPFFADYLEGPFDRAVVGDVVVAQVGHLLASQGLTLIRTWFSLPLGVSNPGLLCADPPPHRKVRRHAHAGRIRPRGGSAR